MNSTDTKGILDQAKGKVKQALGEALHNEKLANEGAADEVIGQAEEMWSKVKDAATSVGRQMHAQALSHQASAGHDLRETMTRAAETAKENISRGMEHLRNDK